MATYFDFGFLDDWCVLWYPEHFSRSERKRAAINIIKAQAFF